MKRNHLLYFSGCLNLFVLVALTIAALGTDDAGAQPVVKQKWATAHVLRVPESVLYDPVDGLLYVSNINGKPLEKNNKGFISKLTIDGEIQTLTWATGLNAPKGAAIYGRRFFVSDIDALVEIDMATGRVAARYPGKKALFLNDVAIDKKGRVYVSDYAAEHSAIYRLENGTLSVWLKPGAIGRPNGLHMDGERLLVGDSVEGDIKSVELETGHVKTVAKIGWGIDGLRPDGNDGFFISDWSGRTAFVTADGKVEILLDTTAEKINSADLEYIPGKKLLLIPTFFDNRVVAYEFQITP